MYLGMVWCSINYFFNYYTSSSADEIVGVKKATIDTLGTKLCHSIDIPYHDRVKSCAAIVAKKKNVCVHVITQKLRDNKCTPPYTITDLDQDLKLCLKSPLLVYPI
jgi:hypothetical protein